MEIKCGRRTFDCTSKDLILDNEKCYILITQKYFKDWHDVNPTVAKTLFKKLLKDGKIRKSKKKYKASLSKDTYYDLYEFVESEGYADPREDEGTLTDQEQEESGNNEKM